MTLPWDTTILRMVSNGFLGQVIAIDVRATVSAFADPEGSPLNWRQDRVLSGNNVLMMGIVYEALMRWVGEATSVLALGKVSVKHRTQNGQLVQVHIPDHLDVLAEMECGAQAHMQFSEVTGFSEPWLDVWLFGTNGTINLTPYSEAPLRAGRRSDSSLRQVHVPSDERQNWRVEAEFVNAIRGYEQVKRTTFADGVRYMEFTDAVHAALIDRREVTVRKL